MDNTKKWKNFDSYHKSHHPPWESRFTYLTEWQQQKLFSSYHLLKILQSVFVGPAM